jgi:hypothetical protein
MPGPTQLQISSPAVDAVFYRGNPYEVKRANASQTTNGQTVIAAVPGYKILVLSMVLTTSAAASVVAVGFYETSGNGIPQFTADLGASSGVVLPFSPVGWFEVPEAKPLRVWAPTATTDIVVTYLLAPL